MGRKITQFNVFIQNSVIFIIVGLFQFLSSRLIKVLSKVIYLIQLKSEIVSVITAKLVPTTVSAK